MDGYGTHGKYRNEVGRLRKRLKSAYHRSANSEVQEVSCFAVHFIMQFCSNFQMNLLFLVLLGNIIAVNDP